MSGIVAYGAYVPRLRLQRSVVLQAHTWFSPALKSLAKGERSMANWDEDVITMATEAARDCAPPALRSRIGTVLLASTTAPYADRQNSGIVKEALNLPDAVATADLGGSQRAGTSALIQALRCADGAGETLLCLAAERAKARPASEPEMINGDAAAAFLVGRDDGIARFVGSHSVSIDFVDHFRSSGEAFDYAWESRWIRDEGYMKIAANALKDALKKYSLSPAKVNRLAVAIPVKGVPEILARMAGIAPESVQDNLHAEMGHAGPAHALVLLANTLKSARPGEHIVVVSFGQGCDVLIFQVTDAILRHSHPVGVDGWLARRKPENNYMKYLFFNGLLDLERGMRAELDQKQPLTTLYRNRKAVLGLVGGRCRVTGTVQFPKSEISVAATGAETGTQDDYPLADIPAHILTYTADSLTYTPDPPNHYGMVAFEGGGRMLCEFADADEGNVEVGAQVRMALRIKACDETRHFTKYFWKAILNG
jgi:3-hydroxy-3-methylglutaryl CoA synthase